MTSERPGELLEREASTNGAEPARGHLARYASAGELRRLIGGVPPLAVDIALALVVGGIGLAQTLQHHPGPGPEHGSGWGPLLVVLAALPIVVRSRFPLLPLLVAAPVAFIYRASGGDTGPALLPAVLLALYTIVADGPYSRATNVSWAAIGAVVFLASHFAGRGDPPLSVLAMDFAWVTAAIVLGDAMRSRRALATLAELRAVEAELTREEEAKRRVSEERVAIARELHDVVAHHISIINVQAGVGAHLLDTRPDQSRQAFEHIKTASHETLQELRSLVDVLREPRDADAPLAPTRGLDGLGELVRAVRDGGIEVRVEEAGVRTELPGHVDRSAYRILQEALTNIIRHAPGSSAVVRIEYGLDRLGLLVTNTAGSGSPVVQESGGHGLHGMRERAEAIGGWVDARSLPDGGFQIRPRPLDRRQL